MQVQIMQKNTKKWKKCNLQRKREGGEDKKGRSKEDEHVEVEKGPEDSLLRPGDLLVHGLVDVPLAVDVGVVHTLCSSNLPAVVQPGLLAAR